MSNTLIQFVSNEYKSNSINSKTLKFSQFRCKRVYKFVLFFVDVKCKFCFCWIKGCQLNKIIKMM